MSRPDIHTLDLANLREILTAAEKALHYAHGTSLPRFIKNSMMSDAVILQMQVAGEAARRLSKEFIAMHPSVHWRSLISMRHFISHQYNDINLLTVYDTLVSGYPDLVKLIRHLLGIGRRRAP